jgi:DNA-directed RNA polymerase subunit H
LVETAIQFNVLEHELVPEHYLLTDEESDKMLKGLRITKDQLPKIRQSDACVRVLENVYGPIREGRIIKVVRRSLTSETMVAYRLVIRG